MFYGFKDMATVDMVEAVADTASVLIEEGGVIKRAPKSEVGGAGGEADLIVTLTGCPVFGIISSDIVTIINGTVTDVIEKIWNGTFVDVRVRGSNTEGSYLATADEVKATAMFYGGSLWIKWVCSNMIGNNVLSRMIKFAEDGTVEAVSNYKIVGTEE